MPTMNQTHHADHEKNHAPRRRRSKRLPHNGSVRAHALDTADARSELLLAAMVAFRDGDFSVRLPTHWSGPDARIAEAFNQAIGHTERMSSEITRLSETRRQGRPAAPAHVAARRGRRLGGRGRIVQHADRRPGASDHGNRAHHRRRRERRPRPVDGARGGRPRAEGRVPALGQAREHDDRAALGLHLRGDARGARGRHRRQARRPGAGEGACRASGRS